MYFRPTLLAAAAIFLSIGVSVHAAPEASIPPIKQVAGVAPNATAFKTAEGHKPIVLRDAKTAAEFFAADALKTLLAKVDFEKQMVLVFAWRGSGGDRLESAVAESFPEQIFFTIKRGRTRDLRPHTAVYVLRSNVRWSVK